MKPDLSFESKKLELIQWLSAINDISIINKVLDLKNKETKDWWNVISNYEKLSIETGLQDADAGKLNPNSKARKLYEKWQ